MTSSILGIIGGSGIYDLPGLQNVREERIKSPWGEPSAALRIGEIGGLPVVFLSRHDKGHRLSPSDINYRANIDVLKRAGVTDLISLSACGSFREDMPPGTFVMVDQFVDRTHLRQTSFFGKGCVAHVSMAHPVAPRLHIRLAEAAREEGIAFARAGTYVCIEGPQFSTKAESRWFTEAGWEVINMTQYPEAYLCRELGMAVVNIALITDYDAGVLEGTTAVTAHDVLAVFEQNAERIRKVVLDMIARFPADLDALGARDALAHTRGDGHASGPSDIRIFETGLG